MSTGSDTIVNATGIVKWFDPKKGFGFVIGPEGQDIFVHYSRIEGEGFRVLRDGTSVVYDAAKTDKGWHASRVVRVPDGVEAGDTADPSGGMVAKPHYARTPRR